MKTTDFGAPESGPLPSIATPRPPGTRVRAPGPALQGLLALAIYLCVFIVGFGQALISHLNQPAVGQIYLDPQFFIWSWGWWPYAVSHLINPLYSGQIGAPTGLNLAWAATTPSAALLMWPVTAAFGPITSFNLALLLAPPTAAWAAFVAARRLTGQFWAALMAGAVFGFNANEIDHEVAGWVDTTITAVLPLLVYLVLLWWDGTLGRTGFIIWMALALTLEFYTYTETFGLMTMVGAVGLAVGFTVAGRAARRRVARLAGHTAIAYAAAVMLALPYLLYVVRQTPSAVLNRQSLGDSLDLAGLVMLRPDRTLGMTWLASVGYNPWASAYMGIPLLLIVPGLAVFAWKSRTTWLIAITFVATILLAAGPSLRIKGHLITSLPWAGLWSLPFGRNTETIRCITFGFLLLAIALALWLAEPTRSRVVRAARWGLGLLAIAAMFANLPTFAEVTVPPPPKYQLAVPPPGQTSALPAFITHGLYRRYLSPGEIVVVISHRGNAGMLFQAVTDFYFRIAGGFIDAQPDDGLPPPVSALADPTKTRVKAFLAYRHAAGIGAVIVEQSWSSKWMYIFGRIGMHGTSVGGVTIYR